MREVAAKTIVRKLAATSLIRPASSSERLSYSNSSGSTKVDTITCPSVSPRATSISDILASTLLTSNVFIPAYPSLSTLSILVSTPVSTKELFKLFIQIYMDNIKNQA